MYLDSEQRWFLYKILFSHVGIPIPKLYAHSVWLRESV